MVHERYTAHWAESRFGRSHRSLGLSGLGQTAKYSKRAHVFRSSAESGPRCANSGCRWCGAPKMTRMSESSTSYRDDVIAAVPPDEAIAPSTAVAGESNRTLPASDE